MRKRIEKIKRAIKRIGSENKALFEEYKNAGPETGFELYGKIGKNIELIRELRKHLSIEIVLQKAE